MSAAAAGPSALAHPSSTVDPQPAASSPHSTTTPQPGPHVHQQPSQLTHQSLLQHNNQSVDLEVDTAPPTDEDHDSAFDTESSASTSLASSIREYEYLNGRRYHSYRSGAYPLPNDEQEQDRLDLLHHIFLQCLGGKLYSAPLEHPTKVLDVGTGTGIWAIDFGDEHPAADVIGTDLSPIQPVWTAPNVRFYIDDCESEWVYGAHERFDYIHARGMGGAIKDWDRLIAQCYAHTQPGGWLEFQEPEAWVYADDDTLDRAPHIQQWQKLCNDAAVTFGKELRVGNTLKERMLNAGFVNVHERMIKVSISGSAHSNLTLSDS